MARIIRRAIGNRKRGAAMILALQLITLILIGFLSFFGGSNQSAKKAPADTQVSAPVAGRAPVAGGADTGHQTDQAQTDTAEPFTAKDLTAAEKSALRKTAHFAKKLYEPLASQVFNLQRSRIESQAAQRSAQGPESPNDQPTLTSDRQDYPPYSYVYFHGTGFQPGETVDMIVVETDPVQQSFEPWTVVADANGEFDTSWYIFSQEFNGATFLATATGETSQLTASCTFTDSALPYLIIPSFSLPNSTVTFDAFIQNINHDVGSIRFTTPGQPTGANGWTITSGTVTATSNNSTWSAGVVAGTPPNQTITFEASVNHAVPINGWVRMSITATVGSNAGCSGGGNCNDVWLAESWANNDESANHDSSSNVGEIVDTCESHDRQYTALFVQAAATLTAASSAGASTINVSNVTGFVAGQTVLIDNNTWALCPTPTSNRESRVIQSVGASSITLTTPLSFGHALGQMVAVPDNNVSSGTPHNYKLILVLLRDSMGHADIFLPNNWVLTPVATTTLSANSAVGATTITVASAAGLAAGQTLYIDSGTNNKESRIIAAGGISGNNVTVTEALDFAHLSGATVNAYDIKIDARSSQTNWTATHIAGVNSPVDNEISIYSGTAITTAGNFIMLDFTATAPTGGVQTVQTQAYNGGAGRATGDIFQNVNQPSITVCCPPVIGSPGASTTVEGCPATFTPTFVPPTASDCVGGTTVEQVSDTTSGNNCSKTFTRSWDAVDDCGDHSATVSQSITVHDTTPPTIGPAGASTTVECPNTPVFTPPTASDTCNGATVNQVSDTTANGSCAGTYAETRIWDATDSCGNHSATRSQTITVRDTTAPTIGQAGASTTIECPNAPVFQPPTASDACDGATVNLISDSTTNGSCAGTYTETRMWDATDCSGNHSVTRSQTITVRDTTAPTIGQAGASTTIECPNSPVFTPPSASDACDGATVNLISDSTTNGTCAGTYTETRMWDATDCSGNHSATRSQTITVRDTTAPTIGQAGASTTIECPNAPMFTEPTASDTCNVAMVHQLSDTTQQGSCPGTYSETRTWDATDCSGNHSATRSQTITVVDTTPPTIGPAGASTTIQCPNMPMFTPPMAIDTCGGATVHLVSDTTANGSCANNYSETRTWDATDCSGNHSVQRSQTITVVDTTPPTIGSPGASTTIACNDTPMFTPPTASDACGGATVNQVSDSTTTVGTITTYMRCWNASDACSNTSGTVCQTIVRPACQASPTPTPTPICQVSTSVASNFNGTAISAGRYIWFTSVTKVKGPTNQVITIHFTNQSITSSAFNLSPGDATLIIDPNATMATTTWVGNMPTTTVPSTGLAGNTFLSAFTYLVPANIPGGLNPVTWSGTITSDTPGVTVNWQWAAAVYTSFNPSYSALGVKPVDDNHASIYQNSDHAGTPENYKQNVIGGARGGGGSNYTGSYSGTGGITCPH